MHSPSCVKLNPSVNLVCNPPLVRPTSNNSHVCLQDLEEELTKEESKLADVRDSTPEKGEMGFLMMAAKVQNFRKSSGSGSGEYEADAKAAVLTAMLPAFAPFEAAEEVRLLRCSGRGSGFNFDCFFLLNNSL